jgi:hypothetical protein
MVSRGHLAGPTLDSACVIEKQPPPVVDIRPDAARGEASAWRLEAA